MRYEDLQRQYDNQEEPEPEPEKVCEDCGQRKCVCAQLDERSL